MEPRKLGGACCVVGVLWLVLRGGVDGGSGRISALGWFFAVRGASWRGGNADIPCHS